MMKNLHRLCVTACIILLTTFTLKAQPTLPDLAGVTQRGLNIITWISPYEGIKSIAVQRSADSVYNYKTIGFVKNLKKGNQAFIDGHPETGDNWYRLYIVFNSDLTWYSNAMKLHVDSNQLMSKTVVLPPNDSLQKLLNTKKMETVVATNTSEKPPKTETPAASPTPNADTARTGTGTVTTPPPPAAPLTIEIPDIEVIDAYTYVRSQYVFTNPFTGHVNVELPDNGDHRRQQFSIDFYNEQNQKILQVPKVSEHSLIIDKRNFQRKGLYKFELRKNADILETGYITIY